MLPHIRALFLKNAGDQSGALLLENSIWRGVEMAGVVDFNAGARHVLGPALNAFPIIPSDNVPQPGIPTRVYVGGAGNLTVVMRGDAQSNFGAGPFGSFAPVTFSNIPAGTILPISPSYVMATGTTATNLVGLL